jgi:hypothetical protein
MNQMMNLTTEEFNYFINNPLPPPIEFADRTQNGDFGLLPIELWNKIYDIKHAMEEKEYGEAMTKKYHNECEWRLERCKIEYIKLKNLQLSHTFNLENCKKFINHFARDEISGISLGESFDRKAFEEQTGSTYYPIHWLNNFIRDNLLNQNYHNFFDEQEEEEDFVYKMLESKRPRKKNVERFNNLMNECLNKYTEDMTDDIFIKKKVTAGTCHSFINYNNMGWESVEAFCKGFNFNHIEWAKKDMEESQARLIENDKEDEVYEKIMDKLYIYKNGVYRSSEY